MEERSKAINIQYLPIPRNILGLRVTVTIKARIVSFVINLRDKHLIVSNRTNSRVTTKSLVSFTTS